MKYGVAMETLAGAKIANKNKMANSRLAVPNQNDVERLKENAKNQNTSRAAQTWLKVWQKWGNCAKSRLETRWVPE